MFTLKEQTAQLIAEAKSQFREEIDCILTMGDNTASHSQRLSDEIDTMIALEQDD